MKDVFEKISFSGRRAPLVQKVVSDGLKMYDLARYVIVLDEEGQVIEKFDNAPFGGTVDCLVVLAPCMYSGTLIEKTVVLEIGFRRFVPYAQAEYRKVGTTKRGPHLRRKSDEVKTKNLVSVKKDKTVFAIKPRTPIARICDKVMLQVLPVILDGIQFCVDEILKGWTAHEVIQTRYPKKDQSYTYIASIFVRFPKQEHLLCAGAKFAEFRYRTGETKDIAANAKVVKENCRLFMKVYKRSKTEDGEYSESVVINSNTASFIASFLCTKILYFGYSIHIVERLLALVGKPDCPERRLLEQIQKMYKLPKPEEDNCFLLAEENYSSLKERILAAWHLETFGSPRHDKRRIKHAKDALTVRVSGSRGEMEAMMSKLMLEKCSPQNEDF